MDTRIAAISIIVENGSAVEKLKANLHEYGRHIVDRLPGVGTKTAFSNVISYGE